MSRPKAKRIARLIRKTEHLAEQAERSRIAITWICEGCRRYQMVFIPSITPNEADQSEFTVQCPDCGGRSTGIVPKGTWRRVPVPEISPKSKHSREPFP